MESLPTANVCWHGQTRWNGYSKPRRRYDYVRDPSGPAIVSGDGLPLIRWFPQRIDKAQGAFFVALTPEVDAFVQASPLPVIKQPLSEPRLLKPSAPPEWAISHLASLPSYLQVLVPSARQKFIDWMSVQA